MEIDLATFRNYVPASLVADDSVYTLCLNDAKRQVVLDKIKVENEYFDMLQRLYALHLLHVFISTKGAAQIIGTMSILDGRYRLDGTSYFSPTAKPSALVDQSNSKEIQSFNIGGISLTYATSKIQRTTSFLEKNTMELSNNKEFSYIDQYYILLKKLNNRIGAMIV